MFVNHRHIDGITVEDIVDALKTLTTTEPTRTVKEEITKEQEGELDELKVSTKQLLTSLQRNGEMLTQQDLTALVRDLERLHSAHPPAKATLQQSNLTATDFVNKVLGFISGPSAEN